MPKCQTFGSGIFFVIWYVHSSLIVIQSEAKDLDNT